MPLIDITQQSNSQSQSNSGSLPPLPNNNSGISNNSQAGPIDSSVLNNDQLTSSIPQPANDNQGNIEMTNNSNVLTEILPSVDVSNITLDNSLNQPEINSVDSQNMQSSVNDDSMIQVRFRDVDQPGGFKYENVDLPDNVKVDVDESGIKVFETLPENQNTQNSTSNSINSNLEDKIAQADNLVQMVNSQLPDPSTKPIISTDSSVNNIETPASDQQLNEVSTPLYPEGIKIQMPEINEAPVENLVEEALPSLTTNLDSQPKVQIPLMDAQNMLIDIAKVQGQFISLENILDRSITSNASDIHISFGYRVMLRVDGSLKSIESQVVTDENLAKYIEALTKDRKNMDLSKEGHFDFSYAYKDKRFRVNLFRSMGHFSIVLRMIPTSIKSVEELELPSIVKEFTKLANGLVLVTGPTGSGKSTTLAAMLNSINLNQARHIVTLEDPIEFVFPKSLALVDQREYGLDFANWSQALTGLLRQDPDVVLVGEMRDPSTMASAITTAETGHLVFATLHTNSASQSIDRIIDSFPAEQQTQIRVQLANVIAAVVSQRLVPLPGGGRKAVLEIMIATPAIRNTIREGKTHQIDNMINTSQDIGMISLEKSLAQLVISRLIDKETAKTFTNKHDELELLLRK